MEKVNYLNLACGGKFHKSWVNVDMMIMDPSVIKSDLLKGIDFPDNTFTVVYHSQFIEHLTRDKGFSFMQECQRVLKPGGIIRIVTPDLENIVRNYLFYLEKCISEPNEINAANYDWLLLEMYDQTTRNFNGGEMGKVLNKENLLNEEFIMDRTGIAGKMIRQCFSEPPPQVYIPPKNNFKEIFDSVGRKLRQSYLKAVLPKKETELLEMGRFRVSGEIHYWLYDRYSMTRLLKETGFKDISFKTPYQSNIPNWSSYELDVKRGAAIDPTSLFVEASK